MLSAVLVLPGIAVLTDIYVDKANPNCVAATGSQAAPFCTIQQALGVAANGDTIRVAPGTYVENLTWPVRNVELVGTAGAAVTIVDGNGAGSVVVIPVGATATIDGVTLSNGTATVGAGVFSQGTLTLRNSTVSGNLSQAAYYAAGAGVRSQGDLTLINSTISGNTMFAGYGCGCGLFATGGDVTLTGSRIENNRIFGPQPLGAGLSVRQASSLTITNCTVSGNRFRCCLQGGVGAGAWVWATPLVVNGSTFSGNYNSNISGGGLFASDCNPLTLRNSTFSGNTGAGLIVYSPSGAPLPTTVLNCTIVNNTSIFGAAGFVNFANGAAQVRNTLIAGNLNLANAPEDLGGTFHSLGHNLIGASGSATGFTNGVLGDQVGVVNPGIAPLANNGGLTQTHALLSSSPAVNAGDPAVFEPFDQRGVPRVADRADIGAFEGALPVSYCTAGLSSNFCTPLISSTGAASASAANGFAIAVANLPGQRQGLIFYGVDNTGFTPTPWGNGSSFLCIKSPVQRTALQSSGGTSNLCNGVFNFDWNAFRAANPGALGGPFAAGDIVYAQGWYRDPPTSKGTGFSNALQFVVDP